MANVFKFASKPSFNFGQPTSTSTPFTFGKVTDTNKPTFYFGKPSDGQASNSFKFGTQQNSNSSFNFPKKNLAWPYDINNPLTNNSGRNFNKRKEKKERKK